MFRLVLFVLCLGVFVAPDYAHANIFEDAKDKVVGAAQSVGNAAKKVVGKSDDAEAGKNDDNGADDKKSEEKKSDNGNSDESKDESGDDKQSKNKKSDKEKSDKKKDDNDDSNNDDDQSQDANDDKESDSSASSSDTGATSGTGSTDSDKKLQELKDNAQKMKDKEQSTENKLLGGAAIGTVGIGGMNIASALSEQSADDAAERDMRAYLATFSCDYGTGRNIKGGEIGIELPGGNDLAPLVAEYRVLAADIAQRKAALGIAPGIEADVIFDKSETGLYDNVGIERQSGAFTSLSRALMDEDGDDAAAWAAQKDATASKLKTGVIVAGIGVVGSIAGNLIINNKNKNESDKLLAEYQALKKLESDVNNLPHDDTPVQCNCTTKQICNSEGICNDCPGDKVAVNNICKCPDARPVELVGDVCATASPNVTLQCTPDATRHLVVDNLTTGTCRCVDGYIPDNAARPTSCTCPSDTHEEKVQGNTVQCIEKSVAQNPDVIIPQPVNLGKSQLFGTGLYTIKPAAGAKISEFAGSVKAQNKDKYCIKIVGNTDRTGSDEINIPLSKNRAIAVAKYLVDINGLSVAHVCAEGRASICCTQDGDQPSCRNVQMSYDGNNDCASPDCLSLDYVK
ncbi:MAG: OmpA family protein [Muribaculaceae bacterium]|nr:OmpA family protein [Muribaculaceae bacterium]